MNTYISHCKATLHKCIYDIQFAVGSLTDASCAFSLIDIVVASWRINIWQPSTMCSNLSWSVALSEKAFWSHVIHQKFDFLATFACNCFVICIIFQSWLNKMSAISLFFEVCIITCEVNQKNWQAIETKKKWMVKLIHSSLKHWQFYEFTVPARSNEMIASTNQIHGRYFISFLIDDLFVRYLMHGDSFWYFDIACHISCDSVATLAAIFFPWLLPGLAPPCLFLSFSLMIEYGK